jgi:hypothetical protein
MPSSILLSLNWFSSSISHLVLFLPSLTLFSSSISRPTLIILICSSISHRSQRLSLISVLFFLTKVSPSYSLLSPFLRSIFCLTISLFFLFLYCYLRLLLLPLLSLSHSSHSVLLLFSTFPSLCFPGWPSHSVLFHLALLFSSVLLVLLFF